MTLHKLVTRFNRNVESSIDKLPDAVPPPAFSGDLASPTGLSTGDDDTAAIKKRTGYSQTIVIIKNLSPTSCKTTDQ